MPSPWLSSELDDVGSLRSAVTLCNIKADCLTFIQSLESFTLNCGIMYEDIIAVICCDEAIALFSVEPFYLTCCHNTFESPIYMICIPALSFSCTYSEYKSTLARLPSSRKKKAGELSRNSCGRIACAEHTMETDDSRFLNQNHITGFRKILCKTGTACQQIIYCPVLYRNISGFFL